MTTEHGPWLDVHAHPGRCFLVDMTDTHPMAPLLGSVDPNAALAAGLAAARGAGMAGVSFATVADLAVLTLREGGGLGAGRAFAPGEAQADHQRQIEGMVRNLEQLGAPIARTAADIDRAHERADTAVLLTCEGGDFLEGDLGGLEVVHDAGVSSLTLVHYRVNEIGDIQTEEPVHGGLTDFGRGVVRECNRLGVVIDCAHATLAVTLDVLASSDAPVMISHSHLDHTDRPHPRLLSDAHARSVADAGGLVGAWPSGVTSATLDDFIDEIVRLVDVVGIDHVAIGTDLDANYRPVVTEHAQFATIAEVLLARGVSGHEVDRVLGGNALELFRTVTG